MSPKYIAARCGTTLAMIERHYGGYMPENEDALLALLMGTAPAANRENPRPPRRKVAVGAENSLEREASPTGFEGVVARFLRIVKEQEKSVTSR